jgi:AraC family transcriptional regulator
LFKMSTGYAPHKYVLLQRIERAKQELRDGRHSVLEVALAVGFQNPSHFAHMFRKLVRTTPTRFQNQR